MREVGQTKAVQAGGWGGIPEAERYSAEPRHRVGKARRTAVECGFICCQSRRQFGQRHKAVCLVVAVRLPALTVVENKRYWPNNAYYYPYDYSGDII